MSSCSTLEGSRSHQGNRLASSLVPGCHHITKAGAVIPLLGLHLLGQGETLTIFLIPYSPRDLEGAEAVMIPTCCVPHPSTDPREPRAFGDDGEDPRAHPITHDPPDKVRIAPSGLSCLGVTWQSCCPDLPAGSGRGPLPCFAALLRVAAVFPILTPPFLSFVFRKQKYFYKGGLVWDENSSDGRYVKENCKPLKVSFWLPPAQLMPRRPQALGKYTAEARQLTMASSFRLCGSLCPRLPGAGSKASCKLP